MQVSTVSLVFLKVPNMILVKSSLCRYLLCHKPDQWSPDLRVKFIRSFDVFVRILRGMQVSRA